MTTPLILAIDQGTSATKCLVVDVNGAVVARGSAPLEEFHPHPGWVEQDANKIWTSVQEAVRRALDGLPASAVIAVGLSNQRESIVAWDRRTGEALSPVLSWQDQRTTVACAGLRTPAHEALVRQRSGLPLDPMFSALKGMWLLDTLDPRREKARAGEICLGTMDSWLLSRFSNDSPVIEAGNASRTQLMNVRDARWDDDLLALFNIPVAALPRIVSSVGPFPTVKGLFPVPDGVPVLSVMGDSHSALFAHGAYQPGQIKATYGTGSSVMGLIPAPEALDAGLCLTIAWSIDRPAFAAEGNIRAAGSALKWMAEILGVTPQELADLGADASSDGVSLVPGFGGLGAPWWDRDAVGLLTGLTLGSSRQTIARAALESIVQQVTDVVQAINLSVGKIEQLYTDGGPTRNSGLMQMQADLAGCPVARASAAELSALGVAHMAGLTAGVWTWKDLETLPRQQDVFLPKMGETQRSEERSHWLRAVARSRGQAIER